MDAKIYEDAFNLLCGEKIGRGAYRTVFECRLDKSMVVKVEHETDWRTFMNVFEQKFWDNHQHYKKVADWLAPCHYLSPDGRVLIQSRVHPLDPKGKLVEKLPQFLTDRKPENFGWFEGRIVCIDYGITIENPSTRMTKVEW